MRFVDVPHMVRWIMQDGPEAVLSGMIDALEADFRRWGSFELRPRVASHSELGVIELMPTADRDTYSFKYVNGHPGNPVRGYQTVAAFGVLAEVSTGYPRLLAEMTVLTALRTAATTGLATRLLARPDASRHALIGAGSQAEFQVLAVNAVRPVEVVTVYDVDPAASIKLRDNLAPYGVEVRVAASAGQAVAGADIITTCTADKRNAIVLHHQDVGPGVHINGIGGDCPGKTELDEEILDMGSVFVEHTEQTRVEGEIQVKDSTFPVTELWEVLDGRRPGRVGPDQVTVFDSVGFAVEDFSALSYLDAALSAPGGERFYEDIDLLAEPADPKNLFALLGEMTAQDLAGREDRSLSPDGQDRGAPGGAFAAGAGRLREVGERLVVEGVRGSGLDILQGSDDELEALLTGSR
ncbi:ornithine cyclodeaminase [Actinomyces howellii]|uniref:Ornithine cyclodeaminase n=1 Tax=Actinomyces howellii TaxID=52771 RepID=A0A448HFD6_9ACTO|nr:ornithine cyclodeaminase [Actinomyces howellii]